MNNRNDHKRTRSIGLGIMNKCSVQGNSQNIETTNEDVLYIWSLTYGLNYDIFNFTMVQKAYTFNRNGTSNFEF